MKSIGDSKIIRPKTLPTKGADGELRVAGLRGLGGDLDVKFKRCKEVAFVDISEVEAISIGV